MKRATLFLLVTLLCCGKACVSQPLLTPEEAVTLALTQNFAIRLAEAEARIAQQNNTAGNAGRLPTINLALNETFTLSAFQQRLANGNEFNASGAPFNNLNSSLQVSWVIYENGRARFAQDRLQALEEQARLNVEATLQQTAAQILIAYYDVVRHRLQERAIEELIALNEERLRIAETRLTAGLAAQTEVLQARIDLHQLRSNLLLQRAATATAKNALNQLLARDPQTPFDVVLQMDVVYQPQRERLLERIRTAAPLLMALRKGAEAAMRAADEANAARGPRITANGQLVVVRTDNGAGFIRNNNQAGFAVGASLVLPLYNGGNLRRQVEIARIAAEQARLRVDAQQLELETALESQLNLFNQQKQAVEVESQNIQLARQSLTISTERFRLGQASALEIQAAQNTLEQALLRQNLALYNLKISEIQLRLLTADFFNEGGF
ncbi:MAG: TolC family protein [Saprospiraceae bacterium]|nr:TolC family protein [Saprospiraceae bacterium]MDW8483316.1 TolC family protein [Saprospiraceae bacterium]